MKQTTNDCSVVEICCGMGGARKAFKDAGFNVVQSIDIDETVIKFHQKFWGDGLQVDINNCAIHEVENAKILSAGFPCQPFSTSGYRTGFDHQQGNVFSTLMKLVEKKGYEAVLLENVTGLLSNDNNRTFKLVLAELAQRFKTVEWITFNLRSLGIPMNRSRVVILAHNFKREILSNLREKFYLPTTPNMFPEEQKWSSDKVNNNYNPNQLTGRIINGYYQVENFEYKHVMFEGDLMNFIFGKKIGNFKIKSGRFWGRTGKTIFYTSENQFSHSVGTSMGGAPTFGFDPENLSEEIIERVKSISNYQTEHSGSFVFRTTPEETLKFFGPRAEVFYNALKEFDAPLVAKYKLLGNMFSPDQAFEVTQELMKSFVFKI